MVQQKQRSQTNNAKPYIVDGGGGERQGCVSQHEHLQYLSYESTKNLQV